MDTNEMKKIEIKKEEPRFKFIDENSVGLKIVSDLQPEFTELKECLKSENIDVAMPHILMMYDVYLRFVFSEYYLSLDDIMNKSLDSTFDTSLKLMVFSKFRMNMEDYCNNITDDVMYKYLVIYDAATLYMKYENVVTSRSDPYYVLESIRRHPDLMKITLKEFTKFTNDLIEYVSMIYDKYGNTNVEFMMCDFNDPTLKTAKKISFSKFHASDINSDVFLIESNVLSDVTEKPIIVTNKKGNDDK